MTRKNLVLLFAGVAIACALSAADVQAQAKVGTTGLNFLELDVSARSMGMGGSFAAVVDDISAVHYNPAALPYLAYKEAMFTYVSMPAGVGLSFAAFGMPLESIGGNIGVGMTYLGTGDILNTTHNNSNGVDLFGNQQFFSASDVSLGFSYGRYLTDRFSVGVTLKYLQENLELSSASGWAADVGTLYNTGFRNFKVAMSITNFGPDMRHLERGFPLPIDFRFGASINVIETPDHLAVFSAEGSHPSDNLEKYRMGAEYWFKERFALRGGAHFNYDVDAEFEFAGGGIQRKSGMGLAVGGGVKLPFGAEREIRIDYAYEDLKILTQAHRFTMGFAF